MGSNERSRRAERKRVQFDQGICSRSGVTSLQSFAAFQNGAQTSRVRISVTVWDRSMTFFFVSKVLIRPNYFEGQSQGQGHAKVTSELEAEKSLKQSFFIAIRPNLKYTFPQTSAALP